MQKNKHKKWLGKGILLGIGLLVGGMTFGTGLMGSAQAASDSSSVTIEAFPATLAEFSAMPQATNLSKPENTCTLLLCALDLFTKDRASGVEALNKLRGPRPMSPMDVQFVRDRLMDKAYLPKAYFDGATPQNNYTPSLPYTVHFYPDPRPQDMGEGYMRLFLRTPGADSPRPIRLRRKGDQWFIWDYPGILSGIRITAKEDPWQ